MNLPAWNVGLALAVLCLMCWWEAGGRIWWANRGAECTDCGRSKATCSCVDVVFEPWDDDDVQ